MYFQEQDLYMKCMHGVANPTRLNGGTSQTFIIDCSANELGWVAESLRPPGRGRGK